MNSLKVVVFLTKSNTRFKLMEVRKKLTPGDYLAS